MVSFEFDNNSGTSLYVQLYEHLKEEISEGHIRTGERLPSLRNMAKNLGVSVTTVKIAYDQLMVEGYMVSRPQSGSIRTWSPPWGSGPSRKHPGS